MDEAQKQKVLGRLTDAQKKELFKKFSYFDQLPDNIDAAREVLLKYSKIPPEELDDHLYKIRDKAWAIHDYPCIGRFAFLTLDITKSDYYDEVLRRLKADNGDDALLDLGCCVGQALRKLAFEGVDPRRLYGADLHQEFIDLGYELFQDSPATAPYTFVAGDILATENNAYDTLKGKITAVHATNFFHLFVWEQQVQLAVKLVELLRPSAAALQQGGVSIFGGHLATKTAGLMPLISGKRAQRFLHDATSWQKLWDEVGEKTGTRWRADHKIVLQNQPGGLDEEGRMQYVRYGVFRLADEQKEAGKDA